MVTQYTPGPWTIRKDTGTIFIDPVAAVRYMGNSAEAQAEERANARLIAAAPDLLNILSEVIDIGPDYHGFGAAVVVLNDEWRARATALINKIRGPQ